MNAKQLEQRIEVLERELTALKAQRGAEVHHHYHYPPQPLMQPQSQYPHSPWRLGEVWCGNTLESAQGMVWTHPAPNAAPSPMPNPYGTANAICNSAGAAQ